MQSLDTRLLPLLHVLAESGYDWLAFELIGVLQAGLPSVETDEDLCVARKAAADGKEPPQRKEAEWAAPIEDEPIRDQVAFAGEYLVQRLKDGVEFLEVGFEQLGEVLNRGGDGKVRAEVTLVVGEGDDARAIESSAVFDSGALGQLAQAISAWRAQMEAGNQ